MSHSKTPHSGTPTRLKIVASVVLVLAVAGLGTYFARRGAVDANAAPPPAPLEVEAMTTQASDVPIFADGLGSVQASRTVAIHSQVDGKLQDVLFEEGQHVEAGQVLAKIDPRLFQASLDQATAKKAQDDANLIAAQKDLERFKTLAQKSFESQQNVDQQQAKVDQTRAQIAADTAAIESAQTQLDYTTIRAPVAGRIGVRQVDPGNIIHTGDQTPLAIVTQTQPAAVMFTLPAQFLDTVRAAMQRGPVEVLAFDRDNRRQLSKGTLLLVDNIIDQSTATIRLKAMFPNTDDVLWPGEFVNARILLSTRTGVVAIPNTAIQRGPHGVYVWVITPDNTAEDRSVSLGPMTGNITVIDTGLKPGEQIVTDGFFKLQRNRAVTVKAPQSGAAS
ncbi:MAG: efflux RND transporter periplasmic adaptor subunit [Pseudolabrys sp.]